jgi:hypothetical protein
MQAFCRPCYVPSPNLVREFPTVVAATGDAIAFADGCGNPVTELFPITAPYRVDADIAGPFGFALAGRYAAGLAPNQVSGSSTPEVLDVFDRLTGNVTQRYTLAVPAAYVLLQDDGTILVQGTDGYTRLGHPGASDLVLSAVPRAANVIGLAAGRVAYQALGSQVMTVADLAGDRLASAPTNFATGEPAFDGSHLAWAVRPCAMTFVYVWDLNGRAPSIPANVTCPSPRLSFTPRVRGGARTVSIRVGCPTSGRLGCAGTLRVMSTIGIGKHGAKQLLLREYAVAPGRSARFVARLRHSLPRHPRHTVRIRATATGPPTHHVAIVARLH